MPGFAGRLVRGFVRVLREQTRGRHQAKHHRVQESAASHQSNRRWDAAPCQPLKRKPYRNTTIKMITINAMIKITSKS